MGRTDSRLGAAAAADAVTRAGHDNVKVHAKLGRVKMLALYVPKRVSRTWSRTMPMPGSYLMPRSMCSEIPKPKLPFEGQYSILDCLLGDHKTHLLVEIALAKLVLLDLETALQDFLRLGTANRDMARNLFVTPDTERADGIPSLARDPDRPVSTAGAIAIRRWQCLHWRRTYGV